MSLQPGAAARGEGEQIATLRAVLPYLWPAGRLDLKLRVVFALLCLVLAKVVTVLTPFAFKYAVDALTGAKPAGSAQSTAVLLIAGPIAMVVAYGFGRIMMVVFAQL
ncbi:MAG: metal ABC transporter permease, partial [Aestuariivirgaceae bacterium]